VRRDVTSSLSLVISSLVSGVFSADGAFEGEETPEKASRKLEMSSRILACAFSGCDSADVGGANRAVCERGVGCSGFL
jgi:hypothetical protein